MMSTLKQGCKNWRRRTAGQKCGSPDLLLNFWEPGSFHKEECTGKNAFIHSFIHLFTEALLRVEFVPSSWQDAGNSQRHRLGPLLAVEKDGEAHGDMHRAVQMAGTLTWSLEWKGQGPQRGPWRSRWAEFCRPRRWLKVVWKGSPSTCNVPDSCIFLSVSCLAKVFCFAWA